MGGRQNVIGGERERDRNNLGEGGKGEGGGRHYFVVSLTEQSVCSPPL